MEIVLWDFYRANGGLCCIDAGGTSVFVTLSKMYSPGLLDTDNTVCFGFRAWG